MKSNLSAKETLLYNDKEKSEIIFINNLTGENWQEVEKQMAARHKLFTGKAKNLTAHIMISPSIEDGKKQTISDWKEIGNSFLQKAGLSSYQAIAYLHQDKEHFHLHIVANRINEKGEIYRNGNELAMSQRIGDEIAKERGLKRAAEIRRERAQERNVGTNIKSTVGTVALMRKDANEAALKAWSNGIFLQPQYFEGLKAKGYDVRLFFKKDHDGKFTDEIRGYAIRKNGNRFLSASRVGAEFTLRKLNQELSTEIFQSKTKDELSKKTIAKDLQGSFDKIINGQKNFDPKLYFDEVNRRGYSIKEYFNKDTGKLRGYGIKIDNVVFNASEIGAEFTLTNLRKRFGELNPASQLQGQLTKNIRTKINQQRNFQTETQSKSEDHVSKDLKRTIDLAVISSDLRDLTSGHRYQSYNAFISAVEAKGYHVHLRYSEGSLAGYTIHKGTEQYPDKEVDNGQFTLDRLIKVGMFQKMGSIYRDKSQHSIHAKIPGLPVDDLPNEQYLINTQDQNSLNDFNQNFVELEAKKKKHFGKDQIRKIIATELTIHLTALPKNGAFDPEKYFTDLRTDGFEVTKHFSKETNLLRGYSLQKYGFHFHASEIGREFTLKSIGDFVSESNQEKGIGSKKTNGLRQAL